MELRSRSKTSSRAIKNSTIYSTVSIPAKGFTLVEILIVIGLLAIIGGFSAVVSLDNYRMSAFRDERKTLITALQRARAMSLNNINQEPHGVAVLPSDQPNFYVVFEGDSYGGYDPSTDELIPSVYPVEKGVGSLEVVTFAQLSGETECDGAPCDGTTAIRLSDPARSASVDIVVNREGQIDWEQI